MLIIFAVGLDSMNALIILASICGESSLHDVYFLSNTTVFVTMIFLFVSNVLIVRIHVMNTYKWKFDIKHVNTQLIKL